MAGRPLRRARLNGTDRNESMPSKIGTWVLSWVDDDGSGHYRSSGSKIPLTIATPGSNASRYWGGQWLVLGSTEAIDGDDSDLVQTYPTKEAAIQAVQQGGVRAAGFGTAASMPPGEGLSLTNGLAGRPLRRARLNAGIPDVAALQVELRSAIQRGTHGSAYRPLELEQELLTEILFQHLYGKLRKCLSGTEMQEQTARYDVAQRVAAELIESGKIHAEPRPPLRARPNSSRARKAVGEPAQKNMFPGVTLLSEAMVRTNPGRRPLRWRGSDAEGLYYTNAAQWGCAIELALLKDGTWRALPFKGSTLSDHICPKAVVTGATSKEVMDTITDRYMDY